MGAASETKPSRQPRLGPASVRNPPVNRAQESSGATDRLGVRQDSVVFNEAVRTSVPRRKNRLRPEAVGLVTPLRAVKAESRPVEESRSVEQTRGCIKPFTVCQATDVPVIRVSRKGTKNRTTSYQWSDSDSGRDGGYASDVQPPRASWQRPDHIRNTSRKARRDQTPRQTSEQAVRPDAEPREGPMDIREEAKHIRQSRDSQERESQQGYVRSYVSDAHISDAHISDALGTNDRPTYVRSYTQDRANNQHHAQARTQEVTNKQERGYVPSPIRNHVPDHDDRKPDYLREAFVNSFGSKCVENAEWAYCGFLRYVLPAHMQYQMMWSLWQRPPSWLAGLAGENRAVAQALLAGSRLVVLAMGLAFFLVCVRALLGWHQNKVGESGRWRRTRVL
ncbi:putative transmembrane protein [Gregarina niphandrodes]|uniref:Transmembrane protein n=1 Tax=Gregarina niphandrodes TaxID=110365 RepID=A0A023BAH7_GRENI|nr:putative transmembrane protein [Gregarina niphandrodes]EZG78310.1 putative transmembrane protein [Gregarina niphandrodes]|eukprot:XP_011129348.1 putative transmembrane protein [Gregarina niphandrodes]